MARISPPTAEAAQDRADAALALLRAAMVPESGAAVELAGELLYEDPFTRLTRDAFAFHTPGGVRFSYRLGERVKVECPREELAEECRLYLWGTVFGAVAWLNRLMPLHCSAIGTEGYGVAFTAPSGGGKSTLAAAMAARGYRHLCDDTLVLSIADGAPWALPDGKPAKLWDDAARLLSLEPAASIGPLPGKSYVQPAQAVDRPLLLRDIVWLSEANEVSLKPVKGAAKLERMPDLLYRGYLHAALGDHGFHAQATMTLAGKVRFWQLARPIEGARFDQHLDEIERQLAAAGILPG